jgi:hypothetical protein
MNTEYEYFKWYYTDKLEKFCHDIYEFYRDLKVRFIYKPYLIDTKLKRWQWHDIDEVLLYACMNSLVGFVEKEEPFQYSAPEDLEDSDKEIKAIYDWWKKYETRQKEFDDVLNQWASLSDELGKPSNKGVYKIIKGDCDYLAKILEDMENRLITEETEYLIRLMKVRNCLWT